MARRFAAGAGVLAVLALLMAAYVLGPWSRSTDHVWEVRVSARFVDAEAGTPIAGLVVRAGRRRDLGTHDEWRGPFGVTDGQGNVVFRIFVPTSHHIKPYEGVEAVWIKGPGRDVLLDAREGRWTENSGPDLPPDIVLDLGTVRLK